jgi:hypothetical protein
MMIILIILLKISFLKNIFFSLIQRLVIICLNYFRFSSDIFEEFHVLAYKIYKNLSNKLNLNV